MPILPPPTSAGPIVGASAYYTGRTVTALVRSLLNDQATNGAPVVIASIGRTTNVTTVVTQTPHGLVTGDTVMVIGVADTSFNVTTALVTYVSTNVYTYANNGSNGTSTGGLSAGQWDSNGVGVGALFTDNYLIPYVNSAYRKVQRALAMSGTQTFTVDDALFTIPAVANPDPSVQVAFNATSNPALPNTLLEPLKLWERPAGSNDVFTEMNDQTANGGLPSREQSQYLIDWEWRSDGIYFVGATQAQQLRMRYRCSLSDLIDGTSSVLIRNSQDCVAYYTAILASGARGSPQVSQWASLADDALENLISAATRQQQDRVRRRRAYTSQTRWGGWYL